MMELFILVKLSYIKLRFFGKVDGEWNRERTEEEGQAFNVLLIVNLISQTYKTKKCVVFRSKYFVLFSNSAV